MKNVRVLPIQQRLGTEVFLVLGGTAHGSQVMCRTKSKEWFAEQRARGHFAAYSSDQFASLLREVGVVHDGSRMVATEVVDAVAAYLANDPQESTVSAVSSGILTAGGWIPSNYTRLVSRAQAAQAFEDDTLCAAVALPHHARAWRGRLSLR
jgi:hypothetical protein